MYLLRCFCKRKMHRRKSRETVARLPRSLYPLTIAWFASNPEHKVRLRTISYRVLVLHALSQRRDYTPIRRIVIIHLLRSKSGRAILNRCCISFRVFFSCQLCRSVYLVIHPCNWSATSLLFTDCQKFVTDTLWTISTWQLTSRVTYYERTGKNFKQLSHSADSYAAIHLPRYV